MITVVLFCVGLWGIKQGDQLIFSKQNLSFLIVGYSLFLGFGISQLIRIRDEHREQKKAEKSEQYIMMEEIGMVMCPSCLQEVLASFYCTQCGYKLKDNRGLYQAPCEELCFADVFLNDEAKEKAVKHGD